MAETAEGNAIASLRAGGERGGAAPVGEAARGIDVFEPDSPEAGDLAGSRRSFSWRRPLKLLSSGCSTPSGQRLVRSLDNPDSSLGLAGARHLYLKHG